MDDVQVSAMTMIDRDAFSAYPYLPETLRSFTLTPVGTDGDYQVVENAELFPVVADALGVEKLRVLRTPIDVLGAQREQWDDGKLPRRRARRNRLRSPMPRSRSSGDRQPGEIGCRVT